MGDDGVDPTELAGAAEAETESAYAWALDDDEDETETRRLTPRRITGAALAGSLVVIAAAGVVAVLGIRGVWHVDAPVIVAAPSTTEVPAPTTAAAATVLAPWITPTATTVIAQPITPTKTVTAAAPPPVTVQAPMSKTVYVPIPPPLPVNYDQRLIYNLQARGFTVFDAASVTAQAHQACGMLQGGDSPQAVVEHFTGGPFNTSPADAASFVTTVMLTYPSCP
jgi:hypothetical protein